MLAAWLGALPAGAAAQNCALPRDAVTVQSAKVTLGGHPYTVATQRLYGINDATSRLLVLDTRCRQAWLQTNAGDLAHFDIRSLGHTRLLQFITMHVAGDGTLYVHTLLARRGGRLVAALPPLEHTGKDGFYLGRLQNGRDGLVTWTADPRGESEADAHPFVVSTWLWSGDRFAAPSTRVTGQRYAAPDSVPSRADYVALALHLPFHDQTGDERSRFSDYRAVEGEAVALR